MSEVVEEVDSQVRNIDVMPGGKKQKKKQKKDDIATPLTPSSPVPEGSSESSSLSGQSF